MVTIKKVVFITPSLYKLGGDTISTMRLANLVAEKDIPVEVVTLSKRTDSKFPLHDKIKVTNLRKCFHYEMFPEELWSGTKLKLIFFIPLLLLWLYFFFIKRYVIRHKIKKIASKEDVIWPYNYMGYICTPPKRGTFHLHFCHERITSFTEPLLFKTFARPKALVALTKEDQEALQKKWKKRNIEYLPNSLQTNLDVQPKFNNNKIVFLGRICSQKRIKHILKIMSLLKQNNINVTLDIWGDTGSETKKTQRKINRLKISDMVTLKGRTSEPLKVIQEYDIIMLASAFEGFPNVLLEGAACGLAIATTEWSTSVKKTYKDNAIIGKDYKELANNLIPYLNNEDMLMDMKLKAKNVLKEFNDEARINAFMDIYSK